MGKHKIDSLYEKDDQGLYIDLQGVKYRLPPRPKYDEIQGYHWPRKNQKWKREEFPVILARDIDWFTFDEPENKNEEIDWEDARRQEIAKQKGEDIYDITKNGPRKLSHINPDPYYVSEPLHDFRLKNWDRWLNGMWIMVNGYAVYLTGQYWKYLQWHKNDNGYPDFVWEECKDFYQHQYVRESKVDLGRVIVTQRGRGKSARMASRAMDACMMPIPESKNAHVTGQGRNDEDAVDFFTKKVATAYKDLPDFMIPINSNDTDPTRNLKFSPSGRRGKNAMLFRKEQKEAFNSFFDYKTAGERACDKLTLRYYWCEEPGKTNPTTADVRKRHNIVKQCVYRNSKKTGIMEYATTVEDLDVGGEQFLQLWNDSDPYNRNANGQTESWCVRYFMSALTNTVFDEYGFAVVEDPTDEQREWLINTYGEAYADGAKPYHDRIRKSLEDKPHEYIQYVQKFPYTIDEAFMFGGKECPFDSTILLEAQRKIALSNPCQVGDFVWVEKYKKARFQPNPTNGKWHVSWLFPNDRDANNVEMVHGKLQPKNNLIMCAGVDPFANKIKMEKGSDGACTIKMKYNPNVPEEFQNTPVADYLSGQRTSPRAMADDIMAALCYYGIGALIESNKGGEVMFNAFDDANFDNFYEWTPKMWKTKEQHWRSTKARGASSTAQAIEYYVGITKDDIINHGYKLKHLRIIQSCLDLDPEDTQKSDTAVSFCWANVQAEKRMTAPEPGVPIQKLFTLYDHTGNSGKIAQ